MSHKQAVLVLFSKLAAGLCFRDQCVQGLLKLDCKMFCPVLGAEGAQQASAIQMILHSFSCWHLPWCQPQCNRTNVGARGFTAMSDSLPTASAAVYCPVLMWA